MKQIIEYFGGSIVAVMVASCVMGLFSSLPGSLGKIAEVPLIMAQPQAGENQAFKEYQTTLKWKMSIKENYDIRTGIAYAVGDFFTAIDPEGVECAVWFSTGWYEGAPEVQMRITDGGKAFSCSHPGVYLVTVESHSVTAGYYETQIRLVVNGEVTA